MGQKKKLKRFAENELFENVFQPKFEELLNSDFTLKGKWNSGFFENCNPIVAELGCGKGDYVTALSELYPEKNFIGVDIKGARIWKGAKTSIIENKNNVAFLRTRIELTPGCFAKNEISEIWLTFPDPQLSGKKRIKKRLTSSRFLSFYQKFLINNGIIHLKTDDADLIAYTKEVLRLNNLPIEEHLSDVYSQQPDDKILSIATYYEKKWLSEGRTIKYLRFRLPDDIELIEPQLKDEIEYKKNNTNRDE